MAETQPDRNTGTRWFNYFQYREDKDKPSDARNVLLIVAALIATVTFQAGVNPPGGVWQDDGKGDSRHKVGRAIYASEQHAYYVFLVSNSLALSASILIIMSLTYKFPLHFEILVATASMIITYGSAVFAVTPKESVKFRYILWASAVPFALRCLIEISVKCNAKFNWKSKITEVFTWLRSLKNKQNLCGAMFSRA